MHGKRPAPPPVELPLVESPPKEKPPVPHRRRPLAALIPLGLATAVTVGAAGCSHPAVVSRQGDPNSPLHCEAVPSDQVVVSPPIVSVQSGVMSIAGDVHRQPGVTGPLDGLVAIDLIGPDGLKLDKALHAPLQPGNIPEDPNQSARYAPANFGYVPPIGSTVRAHYLTRQEAILQNMKDGVLDYNGNGGHVGDGVPRSQENGSMPTSPAGPGNNSGTGNRS